MPDNFALKGAFEAFTQGLASFCILSLADIVSNELVFSVSCQIDICELKDSFHRFSKKFEVF